MEVSRVVKKVCWDSFKVPTSGSTDIAAGLRAVISPLLLRS